jgi:circadian clock protein KaiB
LLSIIYEPSLSRMARPSHVLQIYIAGEKGRSRLAVQNLKKICEKELPGQYRIEVIDVLKNPQVSHRKQSDSSPSRSSHAAYSIPKVRWKLGKQ